MESMTLSQLIAARIAAKRAEDAAVAERRRIDGVLAELMKDVNKPEGSISQKVDGFKLTVTYKMSRNVDTAALQDAWGKLPIDVQQIFKWSADVTVSKLRELDEKSAVSAARFFETKEASHSIKIEAV